MTTFANLLKTESTKTFTENGAQAYNTSNDYLVDLFASIGSLRSRDDEDIIRLFERGYATDKLLATKLLFYARDIRGGCGERNTFRVILKYLAENHPEAVRPNLDLIGVFGRFDDLYSLVGTPLEDNMWSAMKAQFEEDVTNLRQGNAVSLLGKWIKTPDATSKKTRALGIKTALKLGYTVYDFKRLLRQLRKQIDIVERYMSAGEWDKIKYSAVPSRAMNIYRNAFKVHDENRFREFIKAAVKGEVKINSGTLYPYDITEKFMSDWGDYRQPDELSAQALEAQWAQLPDYVGADVNALVMADTSGSMGGRPMATSVGLAIYFAERNKGAYHNMFMTFSSHPEIITLQDNTLLRQKIRETMKADWGMNTNVEAAFKKILDIAVENNVPQNEMVKSLIIVSDMEFDKASRGNSWGFYDRMSEMYAEAGYTIPNIVFWNVNSRHDLFHADSNRKGVQLVSGQSASTFKNLIKCIDMTPYEMMIEVLNSERYADIKVAA